MKAVRAETRGRHCDEVILATGRQSGSGLARSLRLGPVDQLRRQWGQRLVTFTPGSGTEPNEPQRNKARMGVGGLVGLRQAGAFLLRSIPYERYPSLWVASGSDSGLGEG